ncbi:MAG: hypothetical protein L6R42_011500 [Xanthoria sp. 1 TBL-2021]|nr:MAG: hypothetical protein L6R42_011500 [Xanthoria sp. 1 TBL-2021]
MSQQLEQTEGIVNQLQAQGNNTKTKAARTAAENKDLRAMVNKLELQVNCLTSQQKQDRTDTRMIFKAIEKEFSELSLTTRADQGVDDTTEELQDRFISRKGQQERQQVKVEAMMTLQAIDPSRLEPGAYDFKDPIDTTVQDFINLVERNSFRNDGGRYLIDKFYNLVRNREVLRLAQMVVPQFRMFATEKFAQLASSLPLTNINHAISQVVQRRRGGNYQYLNYILSYLELTEQLPVRTDAFVTTEYGALRQRYKSFVHYILSGGTCTPQLTIDYRRRR